MLSTSFRVSADLQKTLDLTGIGASLRTRWSGYSQGVRMAEWE